MEAHKTDDTEYTFTYWLGLPLRRYQCYITLYIVCGLAIALTLALGLEGIGAWQDCDNLGVWTLKYITIVICFHWRLMEICRAMT